MFHVIIEETKGLSRSARDINLQAALRMMSVPAKKNISHVSIRFYDYIRKPVADVMVEAPTVEEALIKFIDAYTTFERARRRKEEEVL